MANVSESTTSKTKHVFKILFMLSPAIAFAVYTIITTTVQFFRDRGDEGFIIIDFWRMSMFYFFLWFLFSVSLIACAIVYSRAVRKYNLISYHTFIILLDSIFFLIILFSSLVLIFVLITMSYFGDDVLRSPMFIGLTFVELLYIAVVIFFTVETVRKIKKLKKQEKEHEKSEVVENRETKTIGGTQYNIVGF